jgi:hypothetical protein
MSHTKAQRKLSILRVMSNEWMRNGYLLITYYLLLITPELRTDFCNDYSLLLDTPQKLFDLRMSTLSIPTD